MAAVRPWTRLRKDVLPLGRPTTPDRVKRWLAEQDKLRAEREAAEGKEREET